MSEQTLLELINVGKIFGSRLLFKNLNLKLINSEGALLTGANGCGKSTLLRIAAGLSRPNQGKILKNCPGGFAYLGHANFLYPGLSAMENLVFWQKANFGQAKNKELEEVLDLLGLSSYAHSQVRNFSKGMAQRLNFARVFLSQANLFLLDEPFSGIDRRSRQIILDELLKRKNGGAAIFMVSHDTEADTALADKIYLLDKKRLKLENDLKKDKVEDGRKA